MKKIATLLISLVLLNCSSQEKASETTSVNEPDYIIDLKILAQMEYKGVEQVLGKGDFAENVKVDGNSYPKYNFKKGTVEVVFKDGKPNLITIYEMKGARFENCSIDKLGDFDCANRDFKSDDVMRWNKIPGFNEIAFFRKWENGKMTPYIDYAYIKVE